jgi:hypothetical protein
MENPIWIAASMNGLRSKSWLSSGYIVIKLFIKVWTPHFLFKEQLHELINFILIS